MRVVSLWIVALVFCLAAPLFASAQIPVPGGRLQPRAPQPEVKTTEMVVEPNAPATRAPEAPQPEVVVFAAVGEAPAPEPKPVEAVTGIDPKAMAETFTNSVVNAGGGAWDPSLGRMTTGDAEIDRMIVAAGVRHGVDPKLVYAVMNQESTFKRNAVSPKGASGYMQLMPDTARRFGVTNIFDPKQNIDAGTKYLRFLLDLFNNNVELALAGYNAGEYRVIREGYRVPRIAETQNYVRVITSRYYGRSAQRRCYAVTYGPSKLTEQERDEIVNVAYVTTDVRGTDSLSNIY